MIDTVPPAMEVAPGYGELAAGTVGRHVDNEVAAGIEGQVAVDRQRAQRLLPGQIVPNTAVVGSMPVPRTVPAAPTVRPLEETSEPLASSVPPKTLVEPV